MKCNEIKDEMFQFDVLKCKTQLWGHLMRKVWKYSNKPLNL